MRSCSLAAVRRQGATMVALLVAFGAIMATACTVSSASPGKRTIADMRNAGVALTAWLTDNFESLPEGDAVLVDWSQCQPVTHEELAAKLKLYIRDLPAEDGWRRPLEYCLDQENRPPRFFGIRSAGGDGRFEGPQYRVGPIPAMEKDRDLVWFNGYFAAWPEQATVR